ncbi:hypothetical protein FJZ40_03615 [Candidatus Shapirobacteria bacterium]|nr:hypothetical protein [Candidatus Shapirobacteria bacterium]
MATHEAESNTGTFNVDQACQMAVVDSYKSMRAEVERLRACNCTSCSTLADALVDAWVHWKLGHGAKSRDERPSPPPPKVVSSGPFDVDVACREAVKNYRQRVERKIWQLRRRHLYDRANALEYSWLWWLSGRGQGKDDLSPEEVA